MGMFDNVEFEMKCPICGEKVDYFQSKDGPCVLANVSPCEVNNFYSFCDKCKSFIDIVKEKNQYYCYVYKYENNKKIGLQREPIEVCHKILIDISIDEYYILNEEAKEEGLLFDDFINKIIKTYIEGR